MKTISTKVDELVYQKLVESCGKSGKCVSEKVRKLIEGSLETKALETDPTNTKKQAIKISDCPIIPELSHDVKTTSDYVIVNGQHFKKCEPLPKAKITN